MPDTGTTERAQRDLAEGKQPSTAAGEFVKEEIDHIREGKHGARSTKQAIAIGLSQARRAGIPLSPPKRGQASERTRRKAQRDEEIGQGRGRTQAPSRRRSRATEKALQREPRSAASHAALSRQVKQAARRRRSG